MNTIIDPATLLKSEIESLSHGSVEDRDLISSMFPRYLEYVKKAAAKADIQIEEGDLGGSKNWAWASDAEDDSADLWDIIGVEGFWAWYN